MKKFNLSLSPTQWFVIQSFQHFNLTNLGTTVQYDQTSMRNYCLDYGLDPAEWLHLFDVIGRGVMRKDVAWLGVRGWTDLTKEKPKPISE